MSSTPTIYDLPSSNPASPVPSRVKWFLLGAVSSTVLFVLGQLFAVWFLPREGLTPLERMVLGLVLSSGLGIVGTGLGAVAFYLYKRHQKKGELLPYEHYEAPSYSYYS